jgi:uncharacterized repeat protein (TIGR01451 family)
MNARCGLNVMLVLDESGSINNTQGATTGVRNAANAFIGALSGTGSQVGIVEFNTRARFPVPYTAVTPTSVTNLFTPYVNDTNGAAEGYNPGAYSGSQVWTNWDDALQEVQLANANAANPDADLVVFVTDGDPTAYNNTHPNDPSNTAVTTNASSSGTALTNAANHADAVKTQGSHMFVVGVGAALQNAQSENRLRVISGDQKYPSPQSSFGQADYTLVSNFSSLQASLRDIATQLCASSVTVTKEVDADGPGGQGYLPAPGWDFTGNVTTSGLNPSSYTWVQPTPPPSTGPRTVTTGGDGAATFQWNPSAGLTSSITITETQKPGHVLTSVACTKKDAQGQTTSLNVTQGETFSITGLAKLDSVTCTVRNRKAFGSIELRKALNPSTDPGVFDLTIAGPGNYSLTAQNRGHNGTTGAQSVPVGLYTLSEAAGLNTSANGYSGALSCLKNDVAQPAPPSNQIQLAENDVWLCTFTNSRKPKIELTKDVAPNSDPGVVDLLIKQGQTTVDSAANQGDGGTTGVNVVAPGAYDLSEAAGTNTSLADYDAALACVRRGTQTSVPAPSGTVTLAYGDDVVCTFTNTRKQGSIELRKVWVGTPGQTTLQIGTSAGGSQVGSQLTGADGQAPLSTGATTVDTGTYYLSETGGLADYASSLACVNTADPKDPTPVTPGANDSVAVGRNDVIVCTFTNTRKPDFLITKTATPNPASFGQQITYTIQITHIGEPLPIDMSGLVVTDKFDDRADTQTLSLMSGDSAHPGFLDAGETWVYGVLGPDEELGPVTRTADVCGTITNTATAAIRPEKRVPADTQTPPVLDDPGNHFDTETVPVVCTPDLQVVKTGPAQVNFNDTITYTVAVSHAATSDGSPVKAADVTVTDPKVTAGQLVLVSGDDGDAILELGETWIYQITESQPVTLAATTCGPLTNTAILAPVPGETNLANNESTATTTVICTLDVGIAKTSDKQTYQAGETVSYTITVTNNGQLAIPFAQIQVSDPQVPLTLQGAAPAELAPGATLTYTGTRQVTTANCGQVPNTATVTLVNPVQAETTTANNSATHTVSVTCPPPVTIVGAPAKLTIDKRGPLAATAGQLVTYRITVKNAGKTDALNVVIRDPLPSGFTLARRAAGATFRSGVLTWKVGTLAPGKSRTVKLTVRIAKTAAGRRCNVGSARGSNVGQVRDAACTRIKAVAPIITPPVTG